MRDVIAPPLMAALTVPKMAQALSHTAAPEISRTRPKHRRVRRLIAPSLLAAGQPMAALAVSAAAQTVAQKGVEAGIPTEPPLDQPGPRTAA